jgi:hypothetical protein
VGLWDKIKGRGSESTGVPQPDINKPYATVTYRDPETGGLVEVQAFSAVAADEIKRDHPDAKIKPKS